MIKKLIMIMSLVIGLGGIYLGYRYNIIIFNSEFLIMGDSIDNNIKVYYYGLFNPGVVIVGTEGGNYRSIYAMGLFSSGDIEFTYGSGDYVVKVGELVRRGGVKVIGEGRISIKLRDELSPFLKEGYYIKYTKELKDIVRYTQDMSNIDYINFVYNYVSNEISYDKELGYAIRLGEINLYHPDIGYIIKNKKAICIGKSSLMVSMLRYRRIPARIVNGYVGGAYYHSWVEVYEGGEWRLYDPTMKVTYKDRDKIKTYAAAEYY